MRDADVRAAIRTNLRRRYSNDAETRIVEEMGIWSGSVRIDVAVINGELHGYELKSERDTLQRLPVQAELYSQVFDRVTLVAAEKHWTHALGIVPHWWGIITASAKRKGGVRLRTQRRSRKNPDLNAVQLARLLWRAEALDILGRHGLDRGFRSRPIEAMVFRLAEGLSLSILSSEVREALKRRQNWLGQSVGNQT